LASEVRTVLDVGCAAGGFSDIWRSYRPGIRYTGVDLSLPLAHASHRLHPDAQFAVADCVAGLPVHAASADVVQALGWLHWEPRYVEAIRELWRATARYLFFDVRIVEGVDGREARQRLADDGTTVPYLCVGWTPFAAMLRDLGPRAALGYGYWGRPAATVSGLDEDVYFATFVLEKPGRDGPERPTVCVGPLQWPESAAGGVTVLPFEVLEVLAPRESERR
jgi:SAM-dependent methyltransferase